MNRIVKVFMGGGILVFVILTFTIPPNLKAIELSTILPNCQTNDDCEIKTTYGKVTNSGTFTFKYTDRAVYLGQNGGIDTFINYGTMTDNGSNKWAFYWSNDGYIRHIINYGTMGGIGGNRGGVSATTPMSVTNYGYMRGISTNWGDADITIDNRGIIDVLWDGATWYHFAGNSNYFFNIKNYAMVIQQDSNTFNTFTGYRPADGDNSHLIFRDRDGGKIRFQDANSKIILDFGNNFEFGKEYSLNRLIMNDDYWNKDNWTTRLPVEFYRLTTRSELYTLTQSGDNFIVNIVDSKTAGYSTIGSLYKANVRTMNNFYVISNSMIYPRKSQNLRSSSLRASVSERGNPPYEKSLDSALDSTLDSAIPLKSYESFAYRSEAQNRRIQRQNKRNYSRQPRNLSQNLNTDSANETNKTNKNNLRDSANHDYYFILTPFVNYNSFAKSGRYNLSGFDYGFLTAFSAKLTQNNSLGAHFMMSYGSLGDKQDKDLSITNLNLNIGLNYKLDLVWDSYLKARGDFFYFLNQVKTLTMIEAIKPNNLGFGVSVAYGKEWDFRQGGVLGLEVGLDYKGLQSSTISLQNNVDKSVSETYQKQLYNLLYADLGLNYNKYFGDFGINAGLGIRGNITANKLATSKIHISTFNKSVDLTLDNDMFLGYANLGASYVLQAKNFDMEFSLAYYGNFGDRVISNGGGVEWRTTW